MNYCIDKDKYGCHKITMKLTYLICFILMNSYGILHCQTIIGFVYDCNNGVQIENANLHIKNTNIGTSSNELGFFKLILDSLNKDKQLIISHVAYKEITYELKNGLFQDTLNICLERNSINLNETTVTASFIDVLGHKNFSVLDFDVIETNVLLLINDYINTSINLVITNSVFDTIYCYSDEHLKKAKNIYKDCVGKCHLVCKDTVYQIDYYDSILTINYPISEQKFNEVVGNCLFETAEHLVFKTTSNKGFYNEFFAVNKENHSRKIIHSAMQSEKMKQLSSEINWILTHSYLYTNVNEAILFEKRIMYRPSILSMNKIGDSIYLFDFSNNCIDIYSSNLNNIRSVNIDYHKNRNWNEIIIIDQIENLAYTIMTENNFEVLYLINLLDGTISKKVRIPYIYPYKIKVNNGFLYVLFKESSNQPVVKKIYRKKI